MLLINRYIKKELLQIFFFLLSSFFLLYALIDYSMHMKLFNLNKLSFGNIILYYFWQFSQQLNVLLPLSLMIATIKILTSMNVHGELSALFSAGISFKQLFRPFFHISLIIMAFFYINLQFLQPLAGYCIKTFEQTHLKETKSNLTSINVLSLPDNAILLYQNYEKKTKIFSNVLLINNFNEIYRIQTLSLQKFGAWGEKVDVLLRNSAHKIVKKESRQSCFFSKLNIDEKKLMEKTLPLRLQSLSYLFTKISWKNLALRTKTSDKEAEAATFFFYKLFIGSLPLLCVLAPPCFCLKMSRFFPLFFIYAGFLFALFALIALLNACIILSSHQIIPSFWTFFCIFLTLFSFFTIRYYRL